MSVPNGNPPVENLAVTFYPTHERGRVSIEIPGQGLRKVLEVNTGCLFVREDDSARGNVLALVTGTKRRPVYTPFACSINGYCVNGCRAARDCQTHEQFLDGTGVTGVLETGQNTGEP